jgi:hypothetical protein
MGENGRGDEVTQLSKLLASYPLPVPLRSFLMQR